MSPPSLPPGGDAGAGSEQPGEHGGSPEGGLRAHAQRERRLSEGPAAEPGVSQARPAARTGAARHDREGLTTDPRYLTFHPPLPLPHNPMNIYT